MDYQNFVTQMEQDLLNLSTEHEETAKNEHIWALGCDDPDLAMCHEQYADEHRALAEAYRRMSEHIPNLLESYLET